LKSVDIFACFGVRKRGWKREIMVEGKDKTSECF
jgi:hypothetical protein